MPTVPPSLFDLKKCITCKRSFPLLDFQIRENGLRRNECRKCRSARSLAAYHKNPAPRITATIKWQKENPERAREIHNRTVEKNRELINERSRRDHHKYQARKAAYRAVNKARIKTWAAQYRKANADVIRAYNSVYYREHKAEVDARIQKAIAAKPELYKQLHKAAKHRRRVRLENNGPIESFTDREIFRRDNWTCGLCGGSVNQELEHPDPMSASLDHVVPIAKGGGHIRSNVQLAHLRCNLSKRDREKLAA